MSHLISHPFIREPCSQAPVDTATLVVTRSLTHAVRAQPPTHATARDARSRSRRIFVYLHPHAQQMRWTSAVD